MLHRWVLKIEGGRKTRILRVALADRLRCSRRVVLQTAKIIDPLTRNYKTRYRTCVLLGHVLPRGTENKL
jgi:hypothetical protein